MRLQIFLRYGMLKEKNEAFFMDLPIYLSTGTFTGRVNGRDPLLLFEAAKSFTADGFELMIFDEFYKLLPDMALRYRDAGIQIPVLHADKAVGDHMSLPEGEADALRLFEKNLEIASLVGARRLVTHCWGMPPSDQYTDQIYRRVGLLKKAAEERGMTLLCENCVCANHSPLFHVKNLLSLYPDLLFTVDTRCSYFHAQLKATMEDESIWKNVAHLHINDYKGGYKDWAARYPIPQPPEGQIDWPYFFSSLKKLGYRGTVTLEAPAMQEKGLNVAVLQKGLDFIRNGLEQ